MAGKDEILVSVLINTVTGPQLQILDADYCLWEGRREEGKEGRREGRREGTREGGREEGREGGKGRMRRL